MNIVTSGSDVSFDYTPCSKSYNACARSLVIGEVIFSLWLNQLAPYLRRCIKCLQKNSLWGFGIAILLPMVVHYGVSTFSPCPKDRDYRVENFKELHERGSLEDKLRLEQKRSTLKKELEKHKKHFQKRLFFVAAPIGIIVIFAGSVIGTPVVGTGLMFGGILTLMNVYIWYWSELQDWMRFLSLLFAMIFLIMVGYRKLAEPDKK